MTLWRHQPRIVSTLKRPSTMSFECSANSDSISRAVEVKIAGKLASGRLAIAMQSPSSLPNIERNIARGAVDSAFFYDCSSPSREKRVHFDSCHNFLLFTLYLSVLGAFGGFVFWLRPCLASVASHSVERPLFHRPLRLLSQDSQLWKQSDLDCLASRPLVDTESRSRLSMLFLQHPKRDDPPRHHMSCTHRHLHPLNHPARDIDIDVNTRWPHTHDQSDIAFPRSIRRHNTQKSFPGKKARRSQSRISRHFDMIPYD